MSGSDSNVNATLERLRQRSLQAVWHPCTQMKQHETYPLVPVVRGQGVWLYDADGKRYLDAISSWWVNLFGHCHPKITERLREQVGRLQRQARGERFA